MLFSQQDPSNPEGAKVHGTRQLQCEELKIDEDNEELSEGKPQEAVNATDDEFRDLMVAHESSEITL